MMRNRKLIDVPEAYREIDVKKGKVSKFETLKQQILYRPCRSSIFLFFSLLLMIFLYQDNDTVNVEADDDELVSNSYEVLSFPKMSLDLSFVKTYFFTYNNTSLDLLDSKLLMNLPEEEEIEDIESQLSDGEDEDSEIENNLSDLEKSLLELEHSLSSLQPSQKEDEEETPVETLAPVLEPGVKYEHMNAEFDGQNFKLLPQIQLPKNPLYQPINSDKNFWPVFQRLKATGWKMASKAHPFKVSLFFTKGKIPPFLLKRYANTSTAKTVYNNKLINSIGLSGCIGGQKRMQLACREHLTETHGCSYSDLNIQPIQVVLTEKIACEAFFEVDKSDKLWLYKPKNTFHGAGIKLMRWKELKEKFPGCATFNRYNDGVIMEYVSEPATIKGGYKFDFRSYLLVASTKPFLAFYHDGFARKADIVYDVNSTDKNTHITNAIGQNMKDHFFGFEQLNLLLSENAGFGTNFMTEKREYLKQVSRFMLESVKTQEKKITPKNGRFHVFGVDWIVDKRGKIHLLEGNGFPLVTNYPELDLTPKIWDDMTDLVLKIQTDPSQLSPKMTVRDQYKYGGWELIYNELEDQFLADTGRKYDVCETFPLQ